MQLKLRNLTESVRYMDLRLDGIEKKTLQIVSYAMSRLNRSKHEQVGIHIREINRISSILNELRKKCPLCASVSFPEGMKLIGAAIKIYNFRNEGVML